MLFNIVMPVFNGEKFLSKSVQSLLSQAFTDWQLLIIDDGSTDDTARIADAFSESDSRILCIHQKNAGVSNARNVGIRAATADYLIFLDADDELLPNALSLIQEKIVRFSPDVITYNTYECDLDSNVTATVTSPLFPTETVLHSFEEIRIGILPHLVSGSVFGIIGNYAVKRSVIQDLQFCSDMIMCEDLLFDMAMYEKCGSAVCLPDYLYLYRNHPASCVRTFRYKKIDDLKTAFEKKIEFAENHSLQYSRNELLNWFCSGIIYDYWSLTEKPALAKKFIQSIQSNFDLLKLFDEYRNLESPSANSKYIFGNRLERYVLRTVMALKRKIKRFLRK